mmetsp:Transcript_17878/g.58290  ORF Transcript_17878/g.58290 Transcript_17878/m.58290 type:complete len:265 (+) Transcript_17878:1289-2083(+)
MRKGSVQKMSRRCSASSEWFTARESSIGSSGGTTDVTIIMQCSASLYRERAGSARPTERTWPAAAMAKASRKRMKSSVSRSEPLTRSVAKRIVRISLPCDEWKPVRRTTPTAPPPGGCCERGWVPAECCSSLVPPRATQARCSARLSRVEGGRPSEGRGSLSCGVDSPVSADSLRASEPWSRSTSAGTMVSTGWPRRRFAGVRASATRSPGSKSVDESRSHLPQRRASTAEAGVASSESSSTLRRRDLMTVHSKRSSISSVKTE